MKKAIILFVGLMFGMCLVSCGKRDVLQGEWEAISYQIDKENQQINYEISTIAFDEGRVQWNNKNYLYEFSESKESVLIQKESTQKEYAFDVDKNSLLFDGEIYYKKGTKEYEKYKETIEEKAEKELKALKEKIEKEKKLAEEKDKAVKKATELWEQKITKFMNDYEVIVEKKQQQLEQEVLKVLEGKWNYKHPSRTETYTFKGSTFVNYRDWGFQQMSLDGTIEVTFTPNIDCTGLNMETLKDNSLTTDEKLNKIKSSPFTTEWELEDLKNAEMYVTHCFDVLYEQMNSWKDLTFEQCKSSDTNSMSVVLTMSGEEYGYIDIQTFSSNVFTLVTSVREYKIYR